MNTRKGRRKPHELSSLDSLFHFPNTEWSVRLSVLGHFQRTVSGTKSLVYCICIFRFVQQGDAWGVCRAAWGIQVMLPQ